MWLNRSGLVARCLVNRTLHRRRPTLENPLGHRSVGLDMARQKPQVHFSHPARLVALALAPWLALGGFGWCAAAVLRWIGAT
jgi:hypothetical protein